MKYWNASAISLFIKVPAHLPEGCFLSITVDFVSPFATHTRNLRAATNLSNAAAHLFTCNEYVNAVSDGILPSSKASLLAGHQIHQVPFKIFNERLCIRERNSNLESPSLPLSPFIAFSIFASVFFTHAGKALLSLPALAAFSRSAILLSQALHIKFNLLRPNTLHLKKLKKARRKFL